MYSSETSPLRNDSVSRIACFISQSYHCLSYKLHICPSTISLKNSDFNLFSKVVLETKSGPIQTLAIHDVTKFYHNDLIVGDSCGVVTVFCNQQILCRHNLARDNISCLQIQNDACKYMYIGCNKLKNWHCILSIKKKKKDTILFLDLIINEMPQ